MLPDDRYQVWWNITGKCYQSLFWTDLNDMAVIEELESFLKRFSDNYQIYVFGQDHKRLEQNVGFRLYEPLREINDETD